MDEVRTRHYANAVALVCFALILGNWLLLHPYRGMIADGLTYGALALFRAQPQAYADDMMYINGNAVVSVFPWVHEQFLRGLGFAKADFVLVIIGQVLWLAALVSLARALFSSLQLQLWAMFGVVVLANLYGYGGWVGYAQTTLSPRTFAEAAVLAALAAALSGHPLWAYGLAVGGTLIHPLMAAPSLLFLAMLQIGTLRGLLVIIVPASGLFMLLALANIGPFALFGMRYDPDWTQILRQSMPHAFLSNWLDPSLSLGIQPVCVLLIAMGGSAQKIARLARVVLVVLLVFIGIDFIGGELMNDVLIKNLHFWRFLWLVTILGNLFAFPLLFDKALPPLTTRLLLITVLLSMLEARAYLFPVVASLVAFGAVTAMWLNGWGLAGSQKTAHRVERPVAILSIIMVLLLSVGWRNKTLENPEYLIAFLPYLLLPVASASCLWLLLRKQVHRFALWSIACIALGALVLGIALWDGRRNWQSFTNASITFPAPVRAMMKDRSVYVEGGPEINWFGLEQPSYFSCVQSVPILIDRDVAMEFFRRGEVLKQLNNDDFRSANIGYCLKKMDPEATGPKNVAQLRQVCNELSDLDVMVLRDEVANAGALRWDLPEIAWDPPTENMTEERREQALRYSRMYLYDCDGLRR